MQKCGFCSMLSGLTRRMMCFGSRRGSTDSYYRELDDQDTLKIEDKSSDFSDDSGDINHDAQAGPSSAYAEFDDVPYKSLNLGRFLSMHKRRRKRLVTRTLCQEAGLLDDINIGQVHCMLDQSGQWKFNPFMLDIVSGGRCLPVLSLHLFHLYGLMTYFELDAVKVWKLFSLIEEGYHNTNPYHNSVHATDVTQAMHCFLQQKQIRDHMEPLEIMSCLIAAIAHDMDHPGVNQPFLVATSNHLATLYQNMSVLENHHWRSATSCMVESGVFAGMGDIQAKVQSKVCSLILATDITRQQEFLSKFKNYLDTNTLDMTNSEHRHLVLQIALKCADISNPCRPWEISRKWSFRVCEEFFRQGDYERKLNLPVTALCDRYSTSIPKIQAGFFKFVVTPLITEWHRFLQNNLTAQMLENLMFNQNKWEAFLIQETADETRTEMSDADMIDEDLENSTNISDSSELLLPTRRLSLYIMKQMAIKEQLRRFSVPLNVFQDSKFKGGKDNSQESLVNEANQEQSPEDSERALHSSLSAPGHCEHGHSSSEKVLSTEKLLPDSSIALITTPVQASRLNMVIKESGTWKLVRQQTFPPFDTTARSHSLSTKPMYTSNQESINDQLRSETWHIRKDRLNLVGVSDTEKTDDDDAPAANSVGVNLEKENLTLKAKARDSGAQLTVNLTTVQLGPFAPEELTRRRKSMPAETSTITTRERRTIGMSSVIPQFLRRTLSGREFWLWRRGSAPAPVSPSELSGLATVESVTHSASEDKKTPGAIAACQQWLAKAAQSVQECPVHLPRRSSLPVEGSRPAEKPTTSSV